MKAFFNELSLSVLDEFPLPMSEKEAVQALKTLAELIVKFDQKLEFRFSTSLNNHSLSQNHLNFGYLLNLLKRENHSLGQKLVSTLSKYPLLESFDDVMLYFQNQPSIGFTHAHENTGYVFSYHAQVWRESSYNLELISLDKLDQTVEVKQLLSDTDLPSLSEQRLSGKEIWDRRETIFPNLKFCREVETQLEGLGKSDKHLKYALDFLEELNTKLENESKLNYQNWSSVSPESEATLNKYRQERAFTCPDTQQYKLFNWHYKISLDNWRIYFELESPYAYIGYIGEHLRTVRFS